VAQEAEFPAGRVVITEDPLQSLPVGASLPLKPVVFGGSDASVKPGDVRNWDFFDGALLAVGFWDGARLDIHGTAAVVAPGLAVTAAHVIRSRLAELGAGTVTLMCIGVRGEGIFDAWKLRSVTVDHGDIAWLSLELCSAIGESWRFSTVAMTTRAPRVGEELTVVGFRFETSDNWMEAPNALPPLAGRLIAAAGEVQNVYPRQRDGVMVRFPAVEVACGSLGGMSGGAVLDEQGLLVGILSTGFDTDAGDGPIYAAWIISALHLEVNIPWPPGIYQQGVPVLDLPSVACRIIGR
jgi:hypothetical protein